MTPDKQEVSYVYTTLYSCYEPLKWWCSRKAHGITQHPPGRDHQTEMPLSRRRSLRLRVLNRLSASSRPNTLIALTRGRLGLISPPVGVPPCTWPSSRWTTSSAVSLSAKRRGPGAQHLTLTKVPFLRKVFYCFHLAFTLSRHF